jgi:hypothetical protein
MFDTSLRTAYIPLLGNAQARGQHSPARAHQLVPSSVSRIWNSYEQPSTEIWPNERHAVTVKRFFMIQSGRLVRTLDACSAFTLLICSGEDHPAFAYTPACEKTDCAPWVLFTLAWVAFWLMILWLVRGGQLAHRTPADCHGPDLRRPDQV